MSVKYSELKKKDVFNITSGENYGKIQDLIIEKRSGKIQSIVVPGKKSTFLNCESIEIPYCDIDKIGTDAVLVKHGSCKNKNSRGCCNDCDDRRERKGCAEIVNIDCDEE